MDIKELIIENYADSQDVVFADGFDDAIIGFDPNLWKVVYSRNRCIEIMQITGDMSEEDAIDYLEYNTFNTYIGESTPVWVETFDWYNDIV
jgi:hypothetical protein